MFQQTEDDYDLLSERVCQVETDIHNLHKSMNVSTPPTVHIPKKHPLSDSDNSLPDGTSSSRFVTPQQNTTSAYHRPQRNSPRTPIKQYNIPNMDYLRKNVNITCSNQDQILEFYIKFRLAVQKGGIHILPIENITKSASIAQQMPHFTPEDYKS